MADFLAGMAIASQRRSRSAAKRLPIMELRERALDGPTPLPFEESPAGFDVIAEVKRRAPGGGSAPLRSAARLAADYAAGGAAAVSVLTEPLAFDGSLLDLAAVSAALREEDRPIPTMRKDFVVDPYQVFEARAAGAGGLLLIAELLDGPVVSPVLDAVAECGLWVVVEVFSDDRVSLARGIAAAAARRGVDARIGVNVRDLRTLAVDGSRHGRLAHLLPPDRPAVAESGLTTPGQVADAARLGYRGALVGRALVAADDPASLLSEMLVAGRGARLQTA